jgi:hypothetical protein
MRVDVRFVQQKKEDCEGREKKCYLLLRTCLLITSLQPNCYKQTRLFKMVNIRSLYARTGNNTNVHTLVLRESKKYESRVRYFIFLTAHTDFRNAALTN